MTKEKLERAAALSHRIHDLTAFLNAVRLARPADCLFEDFPGMIPEDMQARWRAELIAKYAPELEQAQAEFDAL